jgi:hypothetical protein
MVLFGSYYLREYLSVIARWNRTKRSKGWDDEKGTSTSRECLRSQLITFDIKRGLKRVIK